MMASAKMRRSDKIRYGDTCRTAVGCIRASSWVGASALLLAGCMTAREPSSNLTEKNISSPSAASSASASAASMATEGKGASASSLADSLHKGPILTSLAVLNPASGPNEIRATISESATPELVRTALSEYLLSIPGADVGEGIASSIIAEPGRGAIRSVRSTADAEGVKLRIFATPESNLVAQKDGAVITVKDVGLAGGEGVLAQAKGVPSSDDSAGGAKSLASQKGEATPGATTQVAGKVDSEGADELVSEGADKGVASFLDDGSQFTGRLISLDLQDTDIDNALRIIAEVSNLNIIATEDVTGKVTLRLSDVPWDQALDVILRTNGLDKVQEGNVVRIAPFEKIRQEREGLKQAQQASEELEPLSVKYFRVSYAKAGELKPLLEKVVSERGGVTFDERTNQLIIRDIQRGIRNSAQLIKKLDLRTPQVLLETQIVEARRNFLRELGSQTGFRYVQAPEIGNGTGHVFPSSVDIGGTIANSVATGANPISFLFGSADGSKTLTEVLTAQEQQGRVRVVSKPAVATLNNKPATIKSTVAIRIRIPQGGNVVSTGQNAAVTGGAVTATEKVETGIILQVTPQASPDYYVFLDIKAKSSTLGPPIIDGIPSEIERATNSSVLVSSGQTFAMGGVYKLSEQGSNDGLPWFKDIPVLGTFFRRTGVDDFEEEILFFITPRIVEGSFDDAAMRASL